MVLTTPPFEVEASQRWFVFMPGVGDHKHCHYLAPGALSSSRKCACAHCASHIFRSLQMHLYWILKVSMSVGSVHVRVFIVPRSFRSLQMYLHWIFRSLDFLSLCCEVCFPDQCTCTCIGSWARSYKLNTKIHFKVFALLIAHFTENTKLYISDFESVPYKWGTPGLSWCRFWTNVMVGYFIGIRVPDMVLWVAM